MTRARACTRPTTALLLALLAGCGWHAGIEVPPGARSIGIEAVRRNEHVLERGLEPLLTEQLSRSVSDWVALPLASPSQADLVVRGEILDYRRRSGVRNTQNELIETAVFIRAQAELFDRTSGRTSAPVFAQAWSGFALDDPAQEEAARDRALRVIAETLVLDLFQDGPVPAEPVPQ